jgi:hypothetical protein
MAKVECFNKHPKVPDLAGFCERQPMGWVKIKRPTKSDWVRKFQIERDYAIEAFLLPFGWSYPGIGHYSL